MLITENCIINAMPEKLYHSDPTPVLEGFAESASISSSVLKVIHDKTEAEARLSIRRLNPNHQDDSSKSADVGTIAHDFILRGGDGRGVFEIVPYADFKKDDAKAMKKSIEGRGLIALNDTTAGKILGDVKLMHTRLHEQLAGNKDFPGLMMKGKGEQSGFYHDGKVWNRVRFDWMDENYPDWIFDYKTTGLPFDSWEKNQLWGEGLLYMQERHYRRIAAGLLNRPMKFAFIVQQTFEPFLVDTFVIDASFDEEVDGCYDLARLRLINCLRTGVWRGRPPYTKHSCPPPWIITKWENSRMEREILQAKEHKQTQPDQENILAAG